MYKEGEPKQLTDIPKHPLSISRQGITQIHILMTEWIRINPKQSSKSSVKLMRENGINH